MHHPGPHASLGPSWRVMIVRPSGLGTAAARRTVAEPPHTPLGVIHTLRSPPARPYEASRNSKNRYRRQRAAWRGRFRQPLWPHRCGRSQRPALRSSAAAQVAVRGMEHTGERWLRGRRLHFHITMGEGWPMGVGAVARYVSSRRRFPTVRRDAVRTARARGGGSQRSAQSATYRSRT